MNKKHNFVIIKPTLANKYGSIKLLRASYAYNVHYSLELFPPKGCEVQNYMGLDRLVS